MPKKIAIRLLSVALILTVCALGAESVAHWHGNAQDEQHCQVCHIGHVAIPRPAVQTAVHVPLAIARIAPAELVAYSAECVYTPSIPRAPPA